MLKGPKSRRVTGDGSSSARRNDKPGLARIHSYETGEEVRNLRRVGAPSGEMPLTTDFETPWTMGVGLARCSKVGGGAVAADEAVRSSPYEGW